MGLTGAEVLVQNLLSQGVERIFTLPGAKIDRVLEAIRALNGKIELILCRNEQSAAFMAAGHGRRTGKSGVVLVTSGPGVANLTTSLITATCEGDAVVAIGGAVPLSQRLKRTHQSMDNVGILSPVCKYAVEIDSPLAIGEVLGNAFRNAEEGRPGAAFVSIPMDVMVNECPEVHVLTPVMPPVTGPGNRASLDAAARALNEAKQPLILSGGLASTSDATIALRALLSIHPIPVVSTFQGTGTVAKEMAYLFWNQQIAYWPLVTMLSNMMPHCGTIQRRRRPSYTSTRFHTTWIITIVQTLRLLAPLQSPSGNSHPD